MHSFYCEGIKGCLSSTIWGVLRSTVETNRMPGVGSNLFLRKLTELWASERVQISVQVVAVQRTQTQRTNAHVGPKILNQKICCDSCRAAIWNLSHCDPSTLVSFSWGLFAAEDESTAVRFVIRAWGHGPRDYSWEESFRYSITHKLCLHFHVPGWRF